MGERYSLIDKSSRSQMSFKTKVFVRGGSRAAATSKMERFMIIVSLSISGIVKAGSNNFYLYEYVYKICVLYKIVCI